jgi:hypothetical protein
MALVSCKPYLEHFSSGIHQQTNIVLNGSMAGMGRIARWDFLSTQQVVSADITKNSAVAIQYFNHYC